MRKRKVKILLSALMMLCMVLSGLSVSAADDRLGEVVDGSVLTDEMQAEYGEPAKTKGTYLSSGSGSVTNLGGRQVYISGRTNCYRVSDEVRVTLTLQRLEGNSWVYVGSVGPTSAYNTYTVSASRTFSVSGGYYYRVKGTHAAIKGSTGESCTSYSNGIWVY